MTPEQIKALDELREAVGKEVSEKRHRHILGVEQTAAEMTKKYFDCLEQSEADAEYKIRAAALLHDVTKNKSDEWYASFIREQGIEIPDDEKSSPELFHAHTAPAYICKVYPAFAYPEIISAAWKHTTGDADMTLFDKIVCLADYVEQGRTHPSCAELRERFFAFDFSSANKEEKLWHLDLVLLESLKRTASYLEANGKAAAKRTYQAIETLCKA